MFIGDTNNYFLNFISFTDLNLYRHKTQFTQFIIITCPEAAEPMSYRKITVAAHWDYTYAWGGVCLHVCVFVWDRSAVCLCDYYTLSGNYIAKYIRKMEIKLYLLRHFCVFRLVLKFNLYCIRLLPAQSECLNQCVCGCTFLSLPVWVYALL